MKKLLAMVLAIAMILSMAACGGSGKGNKTESGKLDTSKEVEVVMYFISDRPAGQDIIDENMNKIFKEKLNCTLKVNWIPWSDYKNTYNLLLSSGESVDLIYCAGWLGYSQLAQQGAFKNVDELWPTYAPENYAKATDEAKAQTIVDGKMYCIPTLWATYYGQGPLWRTDILEGTELEGIVLDSFENIEKYADFCKENYPEILPIEMNSNGSNYDSMWGRYLGLREMGIFYYDPTEEHPTLKTFTELDSCEDFLNMMARWNEKGFYSKSCLSDTSGDSSAEKGTAFLRCHNVDSFSGYQMKTNLGSSDFQWQFQDIGKYAAHLPFTQDAVCVPSGSKNPERAVALWNLITTDQEAYDAFYYGIEGTSYKLNDDGSVTMLDPDTYSTSGMWTVRTTGLTRDAEGTPAEWNEWHETWEKMIKENDVWEKYSSLTVDTAGLDTELANINDVMLKYWAPLELGLNTNGIEGGVAEFNEKLQQAGVEKVREAYQKQLDAYVEGLNK